MKKKVLSLLTLTCLLIGMIGIIPTSAKSKTKAQTTYSNLVKKQNKDTGKFNVGKYGITKQDMLNRLYLNKISVKEYDTIKKVMENGYRVTDDKGNIIDVPNDKSIYNDGQNMWFKKVKPAGDTSTDGIAWYSLTLVDPGTSYLKNCSCTFNWQILFNKDYYCLKVNKGYDNITDYFFNKNFAIDKAPSYDNFKKTFLKRVKGSAVKISLCNNNLSWMAEFPIVDLSEDKKKIEQVGTFQILYNYNKDTRECDSVYYQWWFNAK